MSSPIRFKINDFLEVRLENGDTVIYVAGKDFDICKKLLLSIPVAGVGDYDELKSIDDVADLLKWDVIKGQEGIKYDISPEAEFFGHCSNLQAFYEYNYDTRLLHSNIAFPLLKKLSSAGDSLAKRVFKEEIAKRLEENYAPINELFIEDNYFSYFSEQEIETYCPKKLDVYRLILASRGLTEIPPLIDKLPIQGLKSLNLISNRFSAFPSFILRNVSLEVLQLMENQLVYLPESINKLKKLRKLDLSRNKLKSLPNSIGDLKSLKKLNLSDNNLDTLPESIGNLTSLENLSVTNNKLQKLPESIGNLTSLENLSVTNNKLQKLPESIGDLINLEYINLSSNHLSFLPSILNNLKSLKSIDISNNKFKESSTLEFVKVLNLRAARNKANSKIKIAERFLGEHNFETIEQKSNVLRKIECLKIVMDFDDFEEIESRTHDLSFY